MPEVQLSPRRIREHLRRRWYFYLAGIVLLCFLNNLVYTVTRPRTPERALLRVMLVNVDAPEAYSAFSTSSTRVDSSTARQ